MAPLLTYSRKFKTLKNRFTYVKNDINNRGNLFCHLCKDILIEPRQSECGYRFCNACINECKDAQKNCPECNAGTGSIKCDTIHDRAVEKEILSLNIICINAPCRYECKLSDLDAHLEQCEYRDVKCSLCNELYQYNQSEKHNNVDCQMVRTTCMHCGLEMTKRDLDTHLNKEGNIDSLCSDLWDYCPMKCNETEMVNVKTHLKDCPKIPTKCVMSHIGCRAVIPRMNMDDHARTHAWQHTSLKIEEIMRLKTENVELTNTYTEFCNKRHSEIDQLKQKMEESASVIESLQEKLTKCEGDYSCIAQDAKILRTRESLKSVSDTHRLPYGEYTWTIQNINDKVQEAKNGINTQMFSEPFYSHQNGYKMRLKMYPNGDGKGLGHYISMYFVIMKGEYDDELVWPFKRKISLTLLSNRITGHKYNNPMIMMPDNNVECYGKPKVQYNLAAGNPQFISHAELFGRFKVTDQCNISVHVRIM